MKRWKSKRAFAASFCALALAACAMTPAPDAKGQGQGRGQGQEQGQRLGHAGGEDAIDAPLGGATGDAARGHAFVMTHDAANCVLCHQIPDPALVHFGNLGPSLGGVAARLSIGQIRLRIVDMRRLDAKTIMPGYDVVQGLSLVAERYRGKPILTAQEIEDVIAYLETLR